MDIRAALTDLNGRARAFLDGYSKLTITPRINGYADVKIDAPRGLGLGAELSVANRAVQVFDGEDLLFFGKVWEPLELSSAGHKIEARDPLAEFLARRVRVAATYSADDAADIIYDRLALQNAKRNTYLREGTADVSVNRDREVLPGALEKDLVEELANAADGVFFKATPVDDVAGVMADLDILYPDAGVERPTVLFSFGEGTMDTLADYKLVSRLPMNRRVAAASGGTGGRIAEAAEDADSITEYGLFEEELTFSDVTDTDLLEQHAQAGVKPSPPRTVEATPTADAPLLFDDFNVGDFVRLQIKDDGIDILEWARVTEASLEVNAEGSARLVGIQFEFVVGDTVTVSPAKLFRKQLDDNRRRIEALERRQQVVTQTAVSSPGEPTAGGGSGGGGPADPGGAPPPPPATPGHAPTLVGVSALAASSDTIAVTVAALGDGTPTTVSVAITSGGSIVGLAQATLPSGSGSQTFNIGGLTPGNTYGVSGSASNGSGVASGSGGNVTMPTGGPS